MKYNHEPKKGMRISIRTHLTTVKDRAPPDSECGRVEAMALLYAALLGYLFGSLPFAYWFGLMQGKNLMTEEPGNLGTLGAWRTLGMVPGVLVGVLGGMKGLMAVALGEFMARDLNGGLVAGAFAVLGHCYSVWLLGRGGRGLAPAVGVLFAVKLSLLGAGLLLVGLAYALTRNPNRAVFLAALVFPLSSLFIGGGMAYLWFGVGVAAPILLRHRPGQRPSLT